MYLGFGPNRLVCSVLQEMRDQLDALDGRNWGHYKSFTKLMIEEAQTLVNRMESGLEDWSDLKDMIAKKSELKKEIKLLRAERDLLKGEEND